MSVKDRLSLLRRETSLLLRLFPIRCLLKKLSVPNDSYFLILQGKQGSGKTLLSFLLGSVLRYYYGFGFVVTYEDPMFVLNANLTDTTIVFAEGGMYFSSRDFMTKEGRKRQKKLMNLRVYHNLYIFNVPFDEELDKSVRRHFEVWSVYKHEATGRRYVVTPYGSFIIPVVNKKFREWYDKYDMEQKKDIKVE